MCLLESSKGLNKDIMIVSEEWHDGVPFLTKDGQLGRALKIGLGLVLL